MNKYFFIIALLSVLLSSCISSTTPEDYLKQMNITLSKEYQLTTLNKSVGIGESNVEFEMIIDKVDYNRIIKSIESNENFEILDSEKSFPFGDSHTALKTTDYKGFACLKDDIHYLHLFSPKKAGKGWEAYTIFLFKDARLYFMYSEE